MTIGGHIVYLWPGKRHLRPDSTRHTNKLYARQNSCDYQYYKYTRPNRTNLFHKGKIV